MFLVLVSFLTFPGQLPITLICLKRNPPLPPQSAKLTELLFFPNRLSFLTRFFFVCVVNKRQNFLSQLFLLLLLLLL